MTVVAQLMVKIGADVAAALDGLKKVGDGVSGFAQSTGQKLNAVGDGFVGIGKKVTLFSTPVAAGMAVAVKSAGDFESQMNILNIAMQDSGVSASKWSEIALKIGSDSDLVGVSASEAADAITNFGKAGLDVNQILGDYQSYLAGSTELTGALRAAVDLAAASGMSLEAASMGVVQTMQQYGIPFEQATTIMDGFVRTADASTASVEQLLEAQANVGPVMAQMGFSVSDANVQLAMLHDRGIMGAEAGTALKSMWLNMTNPATKAADALADLNINLYDATGNMRDAQSIVSELSTKLAGLSDEQRNLYLQQIAGSYGIKALNILVEEGSIGWSEYETAIAGASSMQEQAAARTQGFEGAMEQFKSVVETFMITAAMPFIKEFLTPFLKKAGEFLQNLMKVHPQFAKWAMVIGAVIVVVGPLLMLIGGMISAIGTIISVVGGAVGAFGALAGGIGAVIGVIGSALAPVIAIILIVVGVVAALKAAWENNFLGMRDALKPFVDAIARAFAYIKSIWDNFKAFLNGDMTWEEFKQKASAALESAKYAILEAFESLKTGLITIWENIKTAVVNKLAEFIAPLVGGMDNAKRIVLQAWENIKTFLVTTWENIKAAALRVWEGIKQAVQTAIEAVRQVVATVLQVLSGDWVGAWERIKGKVTEVWEGIKSGIQTVIDIIVGLVSTGWEKVFTAVSGVVDRIKTAVMNAWEAIKDIWAKLRGQDQQITDPEQAAEQVRIWKEMVTELTAAWQQMSHTVTTIATAVKQFLDTWLASVQTAFTTVWTTIATFLQTTWMTIQNIAIMWLTAMLTLITVHLQQVQTMFITFWTAIYTYLYNTWMMIQTQLATILATMLTNVQQTNVAMLTSFTSTWAAIVSVVVNAANIMSAQTIAIIVDMAKQILQIFDELEDKAYDAGEAFAKAFARGIRAAIPDVAAAAADMAATAASYLPGSDAERGALSNLTERGRQFGITFAQGIMQSAGAVAGAGGAIGSMLLIGMSDNVDVGDVVDKMIERIKIIMAKLTKLAEYFGGPAGEQLKSAKAVLEPVSQVMEMLAKTISGIRALLDLNVTADAERKVRASVAFLQRAIPIIIRGLANAAAQLQGPALQAAKRLAQAAGEIFSSLNSMVSALKSLLELRQGDVVGKMDILLSAIRIIMTKLRGFTMNLRELPILQAALEELIAFLQGVAEIAKILNTGLNIEAVYAAGKSIGELWVQGIVDGIRSRFGQLGDILRQVGNRMATPFGPAPGTPATVPTSTGWGGGGAGPSSAGTTVNVTINNPVGQTAQGDIMRQLRNLSALGVLQPVRA